MARRRGLLRLRAILFSRRLDGEDLPHEVGEFAGKSGVVQRGDAGEIIRLAAVVGTDRFAVVMAEKQRLAAADFAAVQDKTRPFSSRAKTPERARFQILLPGN